MKVQQVNNQQSFKGIKLPEYKELSTVRQMLIRDIENYAGFVEPTESTKVWFFKDVFQEIAVSRLLKKANIPHIRMRDELMPTPNLKQFFANIPVIIGEAIKRDP